MKKLVVLFLLMTLTVSAQVVRSKAGRKIMIFGGRDHKTYLGCLSCSEFATDSVLNEFGSNGSEYQTNSIFNSYGSFGGKYSDTSPCNDYATHPPVIVDDRGNYYGELTMNEFSSKRTKSESLLTWLAGVCESQ